MNQSEKKQKAILKNTFQLLNEKEIKQIKIEEIAEKSEVSKVTIFKYYQSKNQLMNLVIRKFLVEMMAKIEAVLQSDLSFEDSYVAITKAKIEELERCSPIFRENLMTQFSQSADFFDKEMLNIQIALYEALFTKGKAETKIADIYTKEDFIFILNLFSEGMKGLTSEKLISKTEIIKRFFLNGFL